MQQQLIELRKLIEDLKTVEWYLSGKMEGKSTNNKPVIDFLSTYLDHPELIKDALDDIIYEHGDTLINDLPVIE